jgi:hypothetical protein
MKARLPLVLAASALAIAGTAAFLTRTLRQRAEAQRIAGLVETRDGLRKRLEVLRENDPRLRAAPGGDVLIGIPVATASAIVRETTSGFLRQVTLVLQDIDVQTQGTVTTKTLFGRMTPGSYTLRLHLERVRAVLAPGQPRVVFKGHRIGLSLSVRLAEGEGRATVDLDWDAQGVASAVCGDFKAHRQVAGSVKPRSYQFAGSFDLAIDGGALVATPHFDDLFVDIVVEPSAEAWTAVDQIVNDQGLACRTALKLINVRDLLSQALARGFRVTIPKGLLKPVRLPASVEQVLTIEGRDYRLSARPAGLVVTRDILWFGTDVTGQVVPAGNEPAPPAR